MDASKVQAEQVDPDERNIIKLPPEQFADFKDLPITLHELFEVFIRDLIEQYKKDFGDTKGIEFPPLQPEARGMIHKVARYFELASHSRG